MSEVANLPELRSVQDLLSHVEATGDKVTVRAWFQDTQGRQDSIVLSAAAAKRLYGAGNATIVVDGLDQISPRVRKLLDDIQTAVGTPGPTTCNVYASPPAAHTVMHFDPQETFFLQIRGKKKWHYTPNTQLPFPAQASNYYENVHAVAEIGRTFPKAMPRGAKAVVLSPGSVLYMTRGTWHEARSVSHSLALTLTFSSKSWCDVLTDALRERLMEDERWRRPAVGITGDATAQDRATPVLNEMLARLRDEVIAMGGFESA